MIHQEQREKLAKLAAQEHVSAAEIHRRAIDAYDPEIANSAVELERLAQVLIQSQKQAEKAVREAHKALRETLDYFSKKKSGIEHVNKQQDF
jgi:hypothetical protein